MIALYALIVGAAAYRLWRIPAQDSITLRFRDWLYAKASGPGWRGQVWDFVADLVSCPWCIGFWWSGALAYAVAEMENYNAIEFALVWLAGSTICGALAKAIRE